MQLFDIKLWCALSFLARDRDHCEPTDALLATETDASPQTVRRALSRLEAAGFVSRSMDGRTRIITLTPEGDGKPIPAFALRVAM